MSGSVGVRKHEEIKVEEIEVSHTLNNVFIIRDKVRAKTNTYLWVSV